MAKFNSRILKAEAVVEAANNYMADVLLQPFVSMATSVLFNPSIFQYSELGETSYIRYVTAGNFSDYDGTFNTAGLQGSVKQIPLKATVDRKSVVAVDYLKEANSILAGYPLSAGAIVKANWRKFNVEGDMRAISSIYAGTKETNRHINTEAGYKVDAENILQTLLNISKELFENEVEDTMPVYTFVDSQTYSNLQMALIRNYALASLVEKTTIPVNVVAPTMGNSGDGLSINLDVLVFNTNLYIIKVNKNRMKALITSLDGKSGGQEDGGVVADDTSEGAADINILAVPERAAVVSIRHIVNLMMSPLIDLGASSQLNSLIEPMNKLIESTGSYMHIGVNQNSDEFKYVTRVVFGTALLPDYKDTIVAVTSTPALGA